MDGRDQPDTNVVRVRRRGDPNDAERRRLARTISGEQDDVGTFSRGNLVPPRSDHPSQAPDEDGPPAVPYFESLQQSQRADEQIATTAPADADTIAYFEQLAAQSAAEMASIVDGPSVERPMRGSAHLPPSCRSPGVCANGNAPTRWLDVGL